MNKVLMMSSRIIKKGKGISTAVMIEHTLFSLPMAVSAFLLESSGRPAISRVLWILLAVFGARNAANALNRLIDHTIDEENPRTADRDLPAGRIKRLDLWLFTAFCTALFLLSAAMLNWLCLALVPVALILILGYSFTKRFTFLCHYWLGITSSVAVMGSFLALQGRFEWRFFPMTLGVALWVAGFDIIYATQDIEHDRTHCIHSVPAYFGKKGGLIISGLSHLGTLFFFSLNLLFFPLGFWYILGLAITALLLLSQQLIAWRGPVSWIPLASYHLNQLLSPLFLLFTALDIYLPGGLYGK
ncbi:MULTISPECIES: UbiA-like polyprenyltransferase [unclassified Oceanispirochaeta]|uniref:UbiA-like polyprenyltransferase n=1 Tax=unclassified Oceanispirochaeta TaxID=2635722 RepID=UPI000E098E14|nr:MULTISPECIES: UbiA-like polyprenyltransferase [unclassified Oceanispirochaeta]MBF9018884.1 UbiA family prenyltransferase [Oceanispirochaeta sp. M2]NPD75383.1 UbiA family prenyltransferase [Oceanispirochaeta sp. M1]RDG28765.1 4-hydroxybenzoate octaprenyltransferase [Oceanispirochaeta sp. M1]